MNSSKLYSSSLFTLSALILISYVALPTSCGEKVSIDNICNAVEPAMKDKCLQLMKSEPKIASAKSYVELSKLVLEIGVKKAVEAQNHIKDLMRSNPSAAIKECATVDYDEVVGSFKSSLGGLKEDALTANYDAKVAGDGPATCERALASEKINNAQIAALNTDISLLSNIAFLCTDKLPTTDYS